MAHRQVEPSTLLLLTVVGIAFADFAEDICKQTGEKVTANVAVSGHKRTTVPVSFECKSWQGNFFDKDTFHDITKCYTDASAGSFIVPPNSGKITNGNGPSTKTYCMTCDGSKAPKLVLMNQSTDKCE